MNTKGILWLFLLFLRFDLGKAAPVAKICAGPDCTQPDLDDWPIILQQDDAVDNYADLFADILGDIEEEEPEEVVDIDDIDLDKLIAESLTEIETEEPSTADIEGDTDEDDFGDFDLDLLIAEALAETDGGTDIGTTEIEPEITPAESAEIQPEITSEESAEIEPEIIQEKSAEIQPEIISEESAEIQPEITPQKSAEIQPEITPEKSAEIQPEITSEENINIKPEVTPGEPVIEEKKDNVENKITKEPEGEKPGENQEEEELETNVDEIAKKPPIKLSSRTLHKIIYTIAGEKSADIILSKLKTDAAQSKNEGTEGKMKVSLSDKNLFEIIKQVADAGTAEKVLAVIKGDASLDEVKPSSKTGVPEDVSPTFKQGNVYKGVIIQDTLLQLDNTLEQNINRREGKKLRKEIDETLEKIGSNTNYRLSRESMEDLNELLDLNEQLSESAGKDGRRTDARQREARDDGPRRESDSSSSSDESSSDAQRRGKDASSDARRRGSDSSSSSSYDQSDRRKAKGRKRKAYSRRYYESSDSDSFSKKYKDQLDSGYKAVKRLGKALPDSIDTTADIDDSNHGESEPENVETAVQNLGRKYGRKQGDHRESRWSDTVVRMTDDKKVTSETSVELIRSWWGRQHEAEAGRFGSFRKNRETTTEHKLGEDGDEPIPANDPANTTPNDTSAAHEAAKKSIADEHKDFIDQIRSKYSRFINSS